MRRFLILLIVLGGAGTAGYYYLYGRLPWVSLSQEEQQVAAVRAEFDVIRQQWKQAGRAATFGMDTSSVTDTPLAQLERTEKTLADLEPGLQSQKARDQAAQLRMDIRAFKLTMR